jgi:type I restriction enzyme, S subunit
MKQSWEIKKLGEIAKINYGYTEKASFTEVGPKFLRITDIKDNGVEWNYVPYCKCSNSDLPKYLLEEADIVFARTGATTGKSYLVKNPPKAVFASYLIRLKLISKGDFLPEFVSYYFQTKFYWDKISEGISGSAQGGFNATKLGQLNFPIPPLPEQKRIVAILDKAFSAIDKAKANAEKNLKNAKELFESYLQEVFENKGEGWEEKTVEKFVKEGIIFKPLDGNHGEIHPLKNDYVSFGIPFIMSRDMKNGYVDEENCKFITEDQARGLRTGFAVKEDVLLSHKGTIGSVAILETNNEFVILTPQITYYRIKDHSKFYNRFIYYYFLSQGFQKELKNIAKGGSTRAYIGITKQLSLKLTIAPLKEQQTIVKKLDALSAETKKLETIYQKKIDNLEELKKSVLQKAFSGELTDKEIIL